MNKKRILFISNSSMLGGGTNSYLLSLVKYLHNDYECAVVSNRHSSQLQQALQNYGVPHFGLRDRVALFFPALLARIFLGKFDLIYGNGANGRSLWAFRAARLTGRPFIWHIHESVTRTSYARSLQLADVVIANSLHTADCIHKLAPRTNPMVIPCGIDSRDFEFDKIVSREKVGHSLSINPDWFRIINIGRFHHDKNQMDAIRVASKVLEMYPETYLILVGLRSEPVYLSELKNEVNSRGLANNVFFLDYTPNVNTLLNGCDLLLHTAQKEPQGLVILEAMAARLPVVAFNVGGVGESIVQGETGFLRPFGDIEGLVNDLVQLLKNQSLRTTFGNAGNLRVQKYYTAESTAVQVKNIIEEILGS